MGRHRHADVAAGRYASTPRELPSSSASTLLPHLCSRLLSTCFRWKTRPPPPPPLPPPPPHHPARPALLFTPPLLARNEFFQPIYLYSSVTWALWVQCVSCRHRPRLVWTLWGFKKRQRGKKKNNNLKKGGGTPHLSLCLSSSSSAAAAAAAAARHPRIMQHLKPWRALLLLTVLWQPGMSDKYGRMMMTVRRMRVKAEIRLLCLPRAVVHDVSAAFYDFMVIWFPL